MVQHHPRSERLMEYAVGAAGAERSLVLATHLGVCGDCAAEVAAAEALGGALLDSLPPAPLRADALAHALARVERPVSPPRAASPTPSDWIEVPRAVAEAARTRRRWAAPGVWVAPVTGGPRRGYLLRVAGGMSMPRHTHAGVEMVCIVKGAFLDRGETYGPGDFCESDETVSHTPAAVVGGECVCLVAVDSSLIALDWIGKLFQPLVRI